MRRWPRTFVPFALMACLVASSAGQTRYKPPEVSATSEIRYPFNSVASGVVVLDVSIENSGAVKGSVVVRGVPSLTSVATSSIQYWTFTPASTGGIPESSVMRVAFVFRPPEYLAGEPSFKPIVSGVDSNEEISHGYIPAGIFSVVYPDYAMNGAVPGTVVIQAKVTGDGSTDKLKVVRDLYPFTKSALKAASRWRFQKATLDGDPVPSNVVLAFIFTPPLSSSL